MPDFGNLSDLGGLLSWLVTSAGMAFYATWLSGFLDKLRNPKPDANYSPYMEKLSDKVKSLNSIQMMNLSVVAFFVPLFIVRLVIAFVPTEVIAAVAPHLVWVVTALFTYSVQQWRYKSLQLKESK